MPYQRGGITGAIRGAGMGMAFGAPGAVIGAMLGGITGLIGPDPEEEREKRKREAIAKIRQYMSTMKRADIAAAREALGAEWSQGRQAASRQAASTGVGDIQAYLAPIEQKAAGTYVKSAEDISREYLKEESRAMMDIEAAFADRPIEPSIGEELLDAGGQFAQSYLTNQYLKTRAGMIEQPSSLKTMPTVGAPSVEGAPLTWNRGGMYQAPQAGSIFDQEIPVTPRFFGSRR